MSTEPDQRAVLVSQAAALAAISPKTKKQNVKPSTVVVYETALRQFAEFADGDVDLCRVTPGDLDDWQKWLDDRPISAATANSYKRTMKAVLNRLRRLGWGVPDPAGVFQMKKERRRNKAVEYRHYASMLACSGIRDYAMALLLEESGIRRGALTSVRQSRMRFLEDEKEGPYVAMIVYDDKNERYWPAFGMEGSFWALKSWLKAREEYFKIKGFPANDYVFVDLDNGERIKPDTVSAAFWHMKQRAKLPPKAAASPHSFRHRFARKRLEAGMDIAQLKELMGHADIATTMIYARPDEDQMESFFRNSLKLLRESDID